MKLLDASPPEILNALSGVAYVVDPSGVLLLAGGAEWESLLASSGAFLPPCAVLGRNLFDMIEGDEVQTAYRAIHSCVLTGRRHLTFDYRCDAPDRERLMRMALGPVGDPGKVVGVLYQSTLVSSVTRVPLNYLATDEALRRHRASESLPVVTICAWCADVSFIEGAWLKPHDYYARGGSVDVQLSHGVCPSCREDVVDPLLSPNSSAAAGATTVPLI